MHLVNVRVMASHASSGTHLEKGVPESLMCRQPLPRVVSQQALQEIQALLGQRRKGTAEVAVRLRHRRGEGVSVGGKANSKWIPLVPP